MLSFSFFIFILLFSVSVHCSVCCLLIHLKHLYIQSHILYMIRFYCHIYPCIISMLGTAWSCESIYHMILALFANVRVSAYVVTLFISCTDVHPYIHAFFWRRMRILHAILYYHCLTVKSYVPSATLNRKKSFIFSTEVTLYPFH